MNVNELLTNSETDFNFQSNRNETSETEDELQEDELLDSQEDEFLDSQDELPARLHSTKSQSRNKGRATSSTVWKYFKTHEQKRICRRCSTSYALTTGTSTLRRHLESHQIIAPIQLQRTIYCNTSHSAREQQARDDLVIKWIICNTQPFSVVENKEWRDMITKFDPRYQFHNRHTIKDRIMKLFQDKKEHVKLVINQIPGKVSFTSDVWTASNGTAFLSLTIHYVDCTWKLKHFLLDIIPLMVRHTGINMGDTIMEVLHEFNLVEKALALTTDNASSMVLCGSYISGELEKYNNVNFSHYRCAAHILNLAVNQGLELIDRSIIKVRSLMSYIKNSSSVSNALKVLCNIKGIEYLAPEIDVKTRWNSTFYMLEKWKRMEPALNLLAADNQIVHQRYPDEDDRLSINVRFFFTYFVNVKKYY